MRIALTALLLALPFSTMAEEAKPAAPAVTASSAPEPAKIHVTLKDGQAQDLLLKHYDELGLELNNAKGTAFNIPWKEVRSITSDGVNADVPLMQQYISAGAVDVGTRIAPIAPSHAFAQAVWPGILLHGAGYRAAGDNDTFLNLAGGEIFSVVLLSFGLAEALGPDIPGESKATSQSIAAAGGAIFVATWAWDLLGAPSAARRFNERNGLVLLPLSGGAQLAYGLRF